MRALIALGDLALRRGEPIAARELVRRFLGLGTGYTVLELDGRRVDAEALAAMGEIPRAEAVLREVKQLAQELEAWPVLWRATLALAELSLREGRPADAMREATDAQEQLERIAADLPEELRASFPQSAPMRRVRALLRDGRV